jgi:aconitate hydratase
MGVLPLQFCPGENAVSLKLTGKEIYSVAGIREALEGNKIAKVTATAPDGTSKQFDVTVRVDTPVEVEYYRHDGILPYVLRQLAGASGAAA